MQAQATAGQLQAHADRRSERRVRCLKGGRIVFNGGFAVFDCTIRDLSPSGAMLAVDSLLGVPKAFDLVFDGGRQRRHCEARWRAGDRMGVQFSE